MEEVHKKLIDMMRFTHIDVKHDSHQNWSKILSMYILRVFGHIPLDNHWIDHSYQFWPPNPSTRCVVVHWKKIHIFWIYEKLLITQIIQRWLLVGKKVPYEFPKWHYIKIVDPSWHKLMICVLAKNAGFD